MNDKKIDGLTIRSGWRYTPVLSGHDLPLDQWQKEFDYYKTESEFLESTFFKYKNQYYALDQFIRYNGGYWHGIMNFTYFSGLLIHLSDDGDGIIVGYYYS